MIGWKVTLPREKPAEGKAHVQLGVRRGNGGRLETGGQLPEELAMLLIRLATQTKPDQLQAMKAAVDAVLNGDKP